MKFQTKLNILMQKKYFDIGFSTTNYLKYLIGAFAIASWNTYKTVWLLLIYAVFCYIFGILYVKYEWFKAELEISNRFNLFVEEVRKRLKKEKFID